MNNYQIPQHVDFRRVNLVLTQIAVPMMTDLEACEHLESIIIMYRFHL